MGLLDGLRVLDLTQLLPGPYATQLLAELGAEVTKVEPLETGDPCRFLPPHGPDGNGVLFAAVNRGKRSVALDLKSDTGRESLRRLVARADVFVEGFRPGAARRLGVDAATLRALHPKLVHVSITGYGQTGPYAERAGHDSDYLALSGVLSGTGPAGGPPVLPIVQIADLAGGALSALVGILAALYRRDRPGPGAAVAVSMPEGALALNVLAWSMWRAGNDPPSPGRSVLTGLFPCYSLYGTSDARYLAVGALEPKFWMAFTAAIDAADLAADPYGTDPETRERVATILASKDLAYWRGVFAEVDACVEPILDVAESLETPHARARGLAAAEAPPFAFLVDGARPATTGRVPALGEHTSAALVES